jgi:ubiquitin-conjugating enzyme E2 J2
LHSDFHLETWSPAWTVSSILIGLLSFMVEDEITNGSMKSSDAEKVRFAEASLDFNKKNNTFRELFPMLCDDDDDDDDDEDDEDAGTAAAAAETADAAAAPAVAQ